MNWNIEKRVLIVEDDQCQQELYKDVMNRDQSSFKITVAPSVAKAKQFLKFDEYDVAILDNRLEDGYGIDLMSVFNEKKIPVIFVTGMRDDVQTAVSAMKLGAQDYLIKDINIVTDLPQKIQSIMENKREKELEMLYKEIVENTINAVVVTDEKGKILYGNASFYKLVNFSNNELQNNAQFSSLLFGSQFLSMIIESCEKKGTINAIETTLLPQKGTVIPIELSVTKIKNYNKILFTIKDLRPDQDIAHELKELHHFSLEQIRVSLFTLQNIGPTILMTEPLPFVSDSKINDTHHESLILMKTAVYYFTALGQGDMQNVGLYGPFPVPEIPNYIGLTYSFLIKDPANKDPRNKGMTYSFIVFFIPKVLSKLIADHNTLLRLFNKRIAAIPSINYMNLDFLKSLKNHILDLPHEEPGMLLVLDTGGFTLFSKKFTTEYFDESLVRGFLNAINFFSQEKLGIASNIEQIKHQEYTLLFCQYETLMICYIFKGQSYVAEQKMHQFVGFAQKILKDWAKNRVIPKIDAEQQDALTKLANDIFILNKIDELAIASFMDKVEHLLK